MVDRLSSQLVVYFFEHFNGSSVTRILFYAENIHIFGIFRENKQAFSSMKLFAAIEMFCWMKRLFKLIAANSADEYIAIRASQMPLNTLTNISGCKVLLKINEIV